jgi:hypothetical protein
MGSCQRDSSTMFLGGQGVPQTDEVHEVIDRRHEHAERRHEQCGPFVPAVRVGLTGQLGVRPRVSALAN